jgi:hypothetical protein
MIIFYAISNQKKNTVLTFIGKKFYFEKIHISTYTQESIQRASVVECKNITILMNAERTENGRNRNKEWRKKIIKKERRKLEKCHDFEETYNIR